MSVEMPAKTAECPERNKLVDFLLGKLPVSDSSFCEAHIAECDPCEETIRNLNVSDTLHMLAKQGLASPSESGPASEAEVVRQLIDEMQEWPDASTSAALGTSEFTTDLEDRSAEVQHFFQPGQDAGSLGRISKYEIVELLGAGSSGVVYRAVDSQLGRDVALKFLRPSLGVAARQRFMTEAQAAAVINHPNVVQIYEVGVEGKLAFIAMQCLPGQTLESRLAEKGALSEEETTQVGEQISRGIAAAHNAGIIHRDIKPANIWLSHSSSNKEDFGKVTILDFGLARALDEDPQLTCTGLIAGTPCFMSPEQTRGRNIDERSDFFSLGCLLYQCLTGVLPFKSENVLSTLQAVQMHSPTSPKELDPSTSDRLSTLVMTLLEKSPVKRPDNAGQIAAAFSTSENEWGFSPAIEAQWSEAGLGNSAKPRFAETRTNSTWRTAVIGAAAVLALVLGGLFAPQIIRVATNQGQIVIESDDPDVQVEVLRQGERIQIVDLKTKQELNIIAGEYQIRAMGDGNEVEIDKRRLVLKRGGKEIVNVRRISKTATKNAAGELPKKSLFVSTVPVLVGSVGIWGTAEPGMLVQVIVDGEAKSRDVVDDNGRWEVTEQFGKAGVFYVTAKVYDENEKFIENLGKDRQLVVVGQGELPLPFDKDQLVENEPIGSHQDSMFQQDNARSTTPLAHVDRVIQDEKLPERLAEPLGRELPKTDLPDFVSKPNYSSRKEFYRLDAGDVLGIFIEGVIGNFDEAPPIIKPPLGSGLPPAVGYPMTIMEDGTVSLPLVPDIELKGLDLRGAKAKIKEAYMGGKEPILRKHARFLVSIVQKRNYQPPQPSLNSSALIELEVARSKLRLMEMGQKYGAKHPKVMELDRSITFLQEYLDKLKAEQSALENNSDLETPLLPPLATSEKEEFPTLDVTTASQTYDGKTYAQYLRIAKTERKEEVAVPAIRGLIELMENGNRKQVIETSLNFFRDTALPRSKLESDYSRFAQVLTDEELVEILLSEASNGTPSSHRMLAAVMHSRLTSRTLKPILKGHGEAFVNALMKAITEGKAKLDLVAGLIELVRENSDLKEVEGLEQLFLDSLNVEKVGVSKIDLEFVDHSFSLNPESKEIPKAVYLIATDDSQTSYNFHNLIQKLSFLRPNQLELIVPLVRKDPIFRGFVEMTNEERLERKLGLLNGTRQTREVSLFRLIGSFGESAKVFADDFKKLDNLELNDQHGYYSKARETVLSEDKPPLN